MPDHEFLFTLRLSRHDGLDQMLREVTTSLLSHVGYGGETIAEIGGQVQAGVERGSAAGDTYAVQFRAHAGELGISISQGERRIFSTSRRLP